MAATGVTAIRVLILTSSTPANVWLVNRILERHDVVGIAIESPPPARTARLKWTRRREMLRKHGLLRTLNKLAYNHVRSRLIAPREGRIVHEAFFPDGQAVEYCRPVPTRTFPTINGAVEFARECLPDVIAICGTSVVKPALFSLAPLGALNIHTGITPDYRSADPIFWALYNGEPDKVGVTIHFVDAGIDTGPIIHQAVVPVLRDDVPAHIYVRCIQTGAELYLRALADVAAGSVRTTVKRGGRSYRSIDLGLVQYLLFRRRFAALKRRLAAGGDAGCRMPTEAQR